MGLDKDKLFFTKKILKWNTDENKRIMPWKGESDPYKIWLSEIILQQTRVEQGLDYYNRFLKAYPSISKLANAPQERVFKLWEGLGYYSRCKNLIATSRFIHQERKGKFPDTYKDILSLKGVGPYTAAAIASFAFNLPYAVVDGNVFRVLSRFFGIDLATDSTAGKKYFTSLANDLLDKKKAGIYNQAIMDFGALICKPKNPECSVCPLKGNCIAQSMGLVDKLPVKEGKLIKRSRWLYYLVIDHEGKVYVRRRSSKDIWQNLYEFVLLEADKQLTINAIKRSPVFTKIKDKNKIEIVSLSGINRQVLTHQVIQGRFIHIRIKKAIQLQGYKAVSLKRLTKLPFPKFINSYLAENEIGAFER